MTMLPGLTCCSSVLVVCCKARQVSENGFPLIPTVQLHPGQEGDGCGGGKGSTEHEVLEGSR